MRAFFMQTDRVGFAHWGEDDADLALRLWGDEGVAKYISAGGRFGRDEILARLENEREMQRQAGVQYWPVFLLESGEFIGCCGLRPYAPEAGGVELGFHLLEAVWGRGLASEAARRVLQYALEPLGAKAVFAGHHPENQASKRVLEKLGFEYLRDEFYDPTGLCHPTYRWEAELRANTHKIHTTEMGLERIRRNLSLEGEDIIAWCRRAIREAGAIHRRGKNWYVYAQGAVLTVNAHSYTVITAHRAEKKQ